MAAFSIDWQAWAVGALVVLALAYALWYWMPAPWRRRLGRVRPGLAQAPGCGACSENGRCPSAALPPAEAGDRTPIWMKPGR